MKSQQEEASLVADILAYCRARRVKPTGTDADEEHRRDMWQRIRRKFAPRWQKGVMLVLSDNTVTIEAAMFRE
jgi:hypothetical protein